MPRKDKSKLKCPTSAPQAVAAPTPQAIVAPAAEAPTIVVLDANYIVVKEDVERRIKYIKKPTSIQNLIRDRSLDPIIKFFQSDIPYDLNTIFYTTNDITESSSLDPIFFDAFDDSEAGIREFTRKMKNYSFTIALSNPIFGLITTIYESFQDVNRGLTTKKEAEKYREKALQLIDLMIKKGLNVSIASIDGITPLHFACSNGPNLSYVVELLIKNGANVQAKTIKSEATPLHYVSYQPSEKSAMLLLKKGADLSATTKGGTTCARAICDVDRILVEKCAKYVISVQTKTLGYKAAYNVIIKESGKEVKDRAVSVDTDSFVLITQLKNIEEHYKVNIKLSIDEIASIFYSFTAQLSSKLSLKQLLSLEKASWFFKEIPKLSHIFIQIQQKLRAIDIYTSQENELLQEIQKLFGLIAKYGQAGAEKSKLTDQIERSKSSIQENFLILESLQREILDPANIVSDISNVASRVNHLDARLKAYKLGSILKGKTTSTDDPLTSSESDGSDVDIASEKKQAEFDGRFSHENLRLFASEYYKNPLSSFVSLVITALEYTEGEKEEKTIASRQLKEILSRIKLDKSPSAQAIKYAQHYLPAPLLIAYLEESSESSFEDYLSVSNDESIIQALAKIIELKGGTLEVQREWPPETGDFVVTLEKIFSGNYINISRAEFTRLLEVLEFELTGFEEGNLRFHAIHHSGEKIGGHFIHSSNVGRKGEVHRKVFQKLKSILQEDGTFEHYLGHHGTSAALGASASDHTIADLSPDSQTSGTPKTKLEVRLLFERIIAGEQFEQDLINLPIAFRILGIDIDPDLESASQTPSQLNLRAVRTKLAGILEFFHATEHATVSSDSYPGMPLTDTVDGSVPLAGAGGFGAEDSKAGGHARGEGEA